jgi:hypothetical protein
VTSPCFSGPLRPFGVSPAGGLMTSISRPILGRFSYAFGYGAHLTASGGWRAPRWYRTGGRDE